MISIFINEKPLSLLTRIILASTKPNAWILDPFTGSSTTGVAANLLNRRFLGIDIEKEFLELSKKRKIEIEDHIIRDEYKNKLNGFNDKEELSNYLLKETEAEYRKELKFVN